MASCGPTMGLTNRWPPAISRMRSCSAAAAPRSRMIQAPLGILINSAGPRSLSQRAVLLGQGTVRRGRPERWVMGEPDRGHPAAPELALEHVAVAQSLSQNAELGHGAWKVETLESVPCEIMPPAIPQEIPNWRLPHQDRRLERSCSPRVPTCRVLSAAEVRREPPGLYQSFARRPARRLRPSTPAGGLGSPAALPRSRRPRPRRGRGCAGPRDTSPASQRLRTLSPA
jgi:hypothetical protein